ncbi:uncharacterized protein VTP21DRAFT_10488 [Calcarisporiella thermophila]|uniref:uncharacterized protein n=1 Tax=Calcarisporiella thermophila TaxID=911321 RepID=UPI003744440E
MPDPPPITTPQNNTPTIAVTLQPATSQPSWSSIHPSVERVIPLEPIPDAFLVYIKQGSDADSVASALKDLPGVVDASIQIPRQRVKREEL